MITTEQKINNISLKMCGITSISPVIWRIMLCEYLRRFGQKMINEVFEEEDVDTQYRIIEKYRLLSLEK
jgi:hypothetical protein